MTTPPPAPPGGSAGDDPTADRPHQAGRAPCSQDGCDKPSRASGLCQAHYHRQWREARRAFPRPTVTQRFWAKVDRTGDCWTWTASLDPNGYGRFRVSTSVAVKAHVWAWEQERGAKPVALDLNHLCGTRSCVRVSHLSLASHRENLLHGDTVTARAAAATHCPHGHPYSPENTYVRPADGSRHCRTCRAARAREVNERRRGTNWRRRT